MLTGILNGVTGQLDKRFLLNAFFPTVVFSIAEALQRLDAGTGAPRRHGFVSRLRSTLGV